MLVESLCLVCNPDQVSARHLQCMGRTETKNRYYSNDSLAIGVSPMASVIKPFHHSKIGIARQVTEGRLNARAGTQIAYIILTESLGCVLARLL